MGTLRHGLEAWSVVVPALGIVASSLAGGGATVALGQLCVPATPLCCWVSRGSGAGGAWHCRRGASLNDDNTLWELADGHRAPPPFWGKHGSELPAASKSSNNR
jgi:hypothetical protein